MFLVTRCAVIEHDEHTANLGEPVGKVQEQVTVGAVLFPEAIASEFPNVEPTDPGVVFAHRADEPLEVVR